MNFDSHIQDILVKIEAALEQMLLGKPSAKIEDTSNIPRLDRIIELTNMLSGNFAEMAQLARDLAAGNMDTEIPGRRNYLAAPIKELHSQLCSFIWAVRELEKGHIVDELHYAGELSEALNILIRRVSSLGDSPAAVQNGSAPQSVYSWKYHQMLLTLNHLQQMVVVTDVECNVLFANHPANVFFNNPERLRGLDDESQDVPMLEQMLSTLSTATNTFPSYYEAFDDQHGSWYKIVSDIMAFPNHTTVFLHAIEDISEWKTNETQLKISATTDPLTGVYNRALGLKALETAILSRKRIVSCAAFIDIDRLKYINDTYGHNEGDYAIKTIADMLSKSVRSNDTVSRFGGDEFLVVFSDCGIEVAERALDRIYDKLMVVNNTHVKPYLLSFSHGVTQIDETSASTAQELIQLMDKKMYERKKAKR